MAATAFKPQTTAAAKKKPDTDTPVTHEMVPRTIPRRPGKEIPSYSFTNFDDVSSTKAAIANLEVGQLFAASNLLDAMLRDDRIYGCMSARVGVLPALPFAMEPGVGRKAKRIAKMAEEEFQSMCSDEALRELQTFGDGVGLGFGEIIWEAIDGMWWPRINPWHSRYFYYRYDTRSWWVSTMDGVEEVIPGTGQWVVFAPWGIKRGYMRSLVRNLYVLFLLRQWALRDFGRWSEKHGMAIIKGKIPKGTRDEDRERFVRELASLASESTILLPQPDKKDQPGMDVEMLEAQALGYQGFKELLSETNSNIGVTILGQNLTTEVKGGSYAAAKVHQNVRADILQADAELLGSALRRDVLRPWAQFNFGDADLAPHPCWDTTVPEDKKTVGESMKAIGEGITAISAAGGKVDIDAVLAASGVPTIAPAEAPDGGEGEELEDEAPAQATEETEMASRNASGLRGVVEGQLYVDGVAQSGAKEGAKVLNHDLQALMNAVTHSRDFDEMKARILEAYGHMSADKLATLLEKAAVLAELNGEFSADEDT